MESTLHTHARHIRRRPVIAATIAVTAVVVTAGAWLPAAGHRPSVATPELAPIAAAHSGAARTRLGDDSASHPRTEAPVFVLSRGRFTAFDAPEVGSNHFPRINNRGDVVGEYIKTDLDAGAGGFWRDSRGRLTEIAYPGSFETSPLDINDRQEMVGNHRVDADGPNLGFLRDRRGRFTTIKVPGAAQTQAYAINDRGQIVGDYYDTSGRPHGYLWHNGRFTTIDGPDGTGATLTEINDRGQILGVYSTEPGTLSGFLLNRGRYTTIDHPDAPYTIPLGINTRGHIVGSIFDALEGATTEAHGFLLRAGADGPFTPIDIPGAIVGTNATGINDHGQIVGRYGNPDPATNQPAPIMTPADTAAAIATTPNTGVTPTRS
jgi:probable HAF family extracellular repeat protein